MNVLRITNFCRLGKSICHAEYIYCSTIYKIDKKSCLPGLPQIPSSSLMSREYFTDNRPSDVLFKEKKDDENTKKLHLTAKKSGSTDQVMTQMMSIMKTVKMSDLKQAPQPVFWWSAAGLAPFLGPPLLYLLFGFSPMLATLQLTYGATILAFAGGMKWGYTIPENRVHEPSWTNLGWAIIPQTIAWFSLLMPSVLSYVFLMGGLSLAAFVDLTATCYPSWFQSVRLAATFISLVGLFLSWLMHMFH